MNGSSHISVRNQVACIAGSLTFATANRIMQQVRQLIAHHQIDTIDLANINHSDSAGLAILIDWLRFARLRQIKIKFINIPQRMHTFARVNGVDELLFAQPGSNAADH